MLFLGIIKATTIVHLILLIVLLTIAIVNRFKIITIIYKNKYNNFININKLESYLLSDIVYISETDYLEVTSINTDENGVETTETKRGYFYPKVLLEDNIRSFEAVYINDIVDDNVINIKVKRNIDDDSYYEINDTIKLSRESHDLIEIYDSKGYPVEAVMYQDLISITFIDLDMHNKHTIYGWVTDSKYIEYPYEILTLTNKSRFYYNRYVYTIIYDEFTKTFLIKTCNSNINTQQSIVIKKIKVIKRGYAKYMMNRLNINTIN